MLRQPVGLNLGKIVGNREMNAVGNRKSVVVQNRKTKFS